MELYLITGFLGAGKTTFLKNFARQFAGRRLRLIINEFGRAGVDGTLLRELDAALDEISNGSIFCACRLDQFEAALEQAAADAPDVVLVEASGLADPTNVRRVLAQFPAVSYQGSVCVADAARLEKVFSTARACPRQLAVSSLVLLNKTDLATEAQCAEAKALILRANPAARIRRTQFGRFEPEWLSLIVPDVDVDEVLDMPDITLQKSGAADPSHDALCGTAKVPCTACGRNMAYQRLCTRAGGHLLRRLHRAGGSSDALAGRSGQPPCTAGRKGHAASQDGQNCRTMV